MASMIGHRVLRRQEISRRPTAAVGVLLAAALVVSATTIAIVANRAPGEVSSVKTEVMSFDHAQGRGLLPGVGSYADSATAASSDDVGFATGRGGLMESAGLELGPSLLGLSQPRGGIPEMADIQ